MTERAACFLKRGITAAIALVSLALAIGLAPAVHTADPLVIGDNWTLQQDETVAADVYLNSGTVDLNGTF